jgi:hypothetical protein
LTGRCYEWSVVVVTHQRDLVVEAGRLLLRHVAPGGDIAFV